jgi:hypothetical protein
MAICGWPYLRLVVGARWSEGQGLSSLFSCRIQLSFTAPVWQRAQAKGYPVDPSNATYFIGHETIVPREDGKGLPRIVRSTF